MAKKIDLKKQKLKKAQNISAEKGVVKKEKDISPVVSDNLEKVPQHDLRNFARGMTNPIVEGIMLPPKMARQIADEVVKRLRSRGTSTTDSEKEAHLKYEHAFFLDTSAILDERLFELMRLGVLFGTFVIIEPVLSELKHIADMKEDLKKERGKRALKALEQVKKLSDIKLQVIKDESDAQAVDDKIIDTAKKYKGRIITCDYNLSQKAKISGVTSIDIHEVANALKTQAIPGEVFWIKVIQAGKGEGQGVGYLPDGTMIVVEQGIGLKGKTVKVVVSRIIQTEAGKILFSQVSPDQSANI